MLNIASLMQPKSKSYPTNSGWGNMISSIKCAGNDAPRQYISVEYVLE